MGVGGGGICSVWIPENALFCAATEQEIKQKGHKSTRNEGKHQSSKVTFKCMIIAENG